MDELNVLSASDHAIEVVDNVTGHRFTYAVVHAQPGGERILEQQGSVTVDLTAHQDETIAGGRARNFAEMEMLKAGKVDRLTP